MRFNISADSNEYGGLPNRLLRLVETDLLSQVAANNWRHTNGLKVHQTTSYGEFDRFRLEFERPSQLQEFLEALFTSTFTVLLEHDSGAVTFITNDPDMMSSEGSRTGVDDTRIISYSSVELMDGDGLAMLLFGPDLNEQEEGIFSCGNSEEDFLFLSREMDGEHPQAFNLFFPKAKLSPTSFFCQALKFHEFESKTAEFEYYLASSDDAAIDIVLEEYPLLQGLYWICRVNIEACSSEEKERVASSLVGTILQLSGDNEVYLEMDNDQTSDHIPVWPLSISGDQLIRGNLTHLDIDSFEP